MSEETNIDRLISSMEPLPHSEQYVFTTTNAKMVFEEI